MDWMHPICPFVRSVNEHFLLNNHDLFHGNMIICQSHECWESGHSPCPFSSSFQQHWRCWSFCWSQICTSRGNCRVGHSCRTTAVLSLKKYPCGQRSLCTFTKCAYITFIFLSLGLGNVLKQIIGEKIAVLLTEDLLRFFCSPLYARKPSGDNSDIRMQQAAQNLIYELSALVSIPFLLVKDL